MDWCIFAEGDKSCASRILDRLSKVLHLLTGIFSLYSKLTISSLTILFTFFFEIFSNSYKNIACSFIQNSCPSVASFLKLNYCSETELNFLLWEFLLVKKSEIEKTKTTFIISVLKVVYQVVLVFSKSNFFINKNSQGRKLSGK